MTKQTKTVIILLIAVAVVAAGYMADRYWIRPAVAAQPSQGAHPTAPAFTLTDIFGQKLSLNEYQGKVVLLDFWATWCGPCRIEIPGFIELQKEYGSHGFQVIGISEDRDGPAPVLDFYQQQGMNYRVALDDGKVSVLYGGIIGLPTTFLIGRDGRIYEKFPGAVEANYFLPGIKTLLAASPGAEVKNFQSMEGSESIQVETPAEANSVVPGIDVTKLSKADLAQYENLLTQQQCTCGCKDDVLLCRKADPSCDTSRQMAQETLKNLKKPAI